MFYILLVGASLSERHINVLNTCSVTFVRRIVNTFVFLEYNSSRAVKRLKNYARELAAVLNGVVDMEPLCSRNEASGVVDIALLCCRLTRERLC